LSHTQLQAGDDCPNPDCRGHLHRLKQPAVKIHLTGQPIVAATKYEREVLRCSHCQDYFRAELPAGVSEGKYDPTADVAIVQAKYGAGIPFYRLARLQESCGVPLPESVQFERCEAVAEAALPVYKHLLALAADGKLFHTDDTRVMILDCVRQDKQSGEGEKRRATLTSGMVVKSELWVIALYLSGRRHAGENLDRVMEKRSEGLETPIQMADGQSANWSRKSETIESKCLAHGRRKFTEIEESFPVECDEVLKAIAKVYGIEAETKGMSDEQRLKHHQEHSEPVMRELREWIDEQFEARKVEPNSALGKALQYLRNHWAGLTRFLSVAGAPLDNNEVERALKRFVLFRKNSLFYKTQHGSGVGDILMSLIETCRLNRINAWEYLLTLTRNAARAKAAPAAFLPWNYTRGEPTEAREETEAA
jgi:transposase/predicted  nucleic acid-binding Zn-ribbon protein